MDVYDAVRIKKRMLVQPTSRASDALPPPPPAATLPLHPPIADWRDVVARFRRDASSRGWRLLRDESVRLGCPPALWSSLYARTILQRGIFQAALLAVLEEPDALRHAALAEIAAAARAAAAPPLRSPARLPSDFEHRLALTDAFSSPRNAADLCIGIARAFTEVVQHPHHPAGAADAELDAARSAARSGRHTDLLRHVARAGAFAMRGDAVWDGWLREGPAQFQAACAVLMTCLDWLHILHLTPDLSPDAVRAAVAARHTQPAQRSSSTHMHPPLDLESLLTQISLIVHHGGLPPQHPAAHDDEARTRLCAGVLSMCHARADFAAFGPPDDCLPNEPDDELFRAAMAQLEADCIIALGHLRYDAPDAMNTLLHRAVDSDLHPAVGEAAVWALQQLGASSLPLARATMRYASDSYARQQARLIYGGAGRGNPIVFNELAAQFQATRWQDGRADLAMPLALTADPRCMPLLLTALDDSQLTASDRTAILDACDQLDKA